MQASIPKEITTELRAIRKDLNYIKMHIVDSDTVLTPEEEIKLEKSLKEYKDWEATLLEDFEKEMKEK